MSIMCLEHLPRLLLMGLLYCLGVPLWIVLATMLFRFPGRLASWLFSLALRAGAVCLIWYFLH